MNVVRLVHATVVLTILFSIGVIEDAHAQINLATTTLQISICGDLIINSGEECDIPTDTGQYSTTIAGRQCNSSCRWAPYCGDAILHTLHGEECDDGNNVSDDFCSDICKVAFRASRSARKFFWKWGP